MTDRYCRAVAIALLVVGLSAVAVGGSLAAHAWYEGWIYVQSGAAEAVEQQLERAERRPIWLEPGEAEHDVAAFEPPDGGSTLADAPVLPTLAAVESEQESVARRGVTRADQVQPRAAASEIELLGVGFRFLDPPEAGAQVRLTVELRNRAALPTDPIGVTIERRWFEGFQVIGAVPGVIDDRQHGEAARRFDFPGLAPNEQSILTIVMAATGDEVDPPDVRLLLGNEQEIGRAQPQTVAPKPRPGPARTVAVPRLGIKASVVQVPWEPPQFVVGQIRGTANLSEGNTVLIGHLNGPAGNVFAPLGRAQLGDEVVGVSRGLEYRFVISEIQILKADEIGPVQPTNTPRLTLMTCTGVFNPISQDYSHRLWAIAEPPDLAKQTIAANAHRAAEATATALAVPTLPEAMAQGTAVGSQPEAGVGTPVPTATPASDGVAAPSIPAATVAPAPAAAVAAPPQSTPTPSFPTAPRARPQPGAALPDGQRPPPLAGLAFTAPREGERLGRRFTVKGTRTVPVDPNLSAWLLVRAEGAGSRWFVYPQELQAKRDGSWEAEVELGGTAGMRYELRAGVADPETQQALLRHVEEHPGEPLERLPDGFWDEATLVVAWK